MSAEQKSQQQQQPKISQDLQNQQQQKNEQQQHHHHVHCSYEKDIVCDDNQMHLQHMPHQQQQHQQQQQQQQTPSKLKHDEHEHVHCTTEYSLPFHQQQQAIATTQRHQQMPRKHSHSHSPHPSRHTSPHSRHTSPHSKHTSNHSRHTSPHSRHASPHSRHTSPHSRHTSPHSRHTSPHSRRTSPHRGSGHSHHHHFVHDQQIPIAETLSRNLPLRSSVRSTSSHTHSHHHSHHYRRKRIQSQHHQHQHSTVDHLNSHLPSFESHNETCSQQQEQQQQQRHHRSVNDVCNTALNNCNDPSCGSEREFHEHFATKTSGCCSSRTELAQYFAEDLYGATSRRPSSCCTSSDYCYQTDSTSLYGSRSSLSRNNSIKSANVTFRQKKLNKRQPSYSSLRAINTSRPNSQMGSLTSVFDRAREYDDDNYITTDGRSKPEQETSKDALNNELPEYACSPSPIRWSFLADGKSPTDTLEGKTTINTSTSTSTHKTNENELRTKEHINAEHPEKPVSDRYHRAQRKQSCIRGDENPSTSRKCCESPKPYETSTTVQFHQEGESYNNCCNNYIQCNTYLDQDLQITSEDIHQYLSKGNQEAGSVLNNAKTYPFQPSNALEFQYKNNFANNNNNAASNTLSSVEGAESLRSYDSRFRRNSSKETNLNQNVTTTETCVGACAVSSCSSGTPLSPTNINLSSSTNNINIVFSSCLERNANEVKFINTAVEEAREREHSIRDTHHGDGYLPFTYPAYDYTNMSASSIFEKPLGIDELPKEFNSATETTGNTSSSQHSSSLQSPEPNRVSFESFDAASEHNLLSRQGSCQYSSTPRTPRSPDSTANSSTYSAAVNIAAASYAHPSAHHVHYDYPTGTRQCLSYDQQQQQQQEQCSQLAYQAHHHHHHHHHHRYQQHNTESFKLSNAFKKVRKRARKYTDFLRKK